jgi:hypothetical protein
VDGEEVWSAPADRSASAVVLEVDELYVGDGEVLRPGALVMRDGRIVEVGRRVSRPPGARVVRGAAAMPGMIDALGHLGLEGSTKVPNADYKLGSIVGPGDRVDRRVALAGVTAVALAPRDGSGSGTPIMVYKPAANDWEKQVVRDPVALRLKWTERNRIESGDDVRELLEKAKAYRQSWIDYEKALAEWTPPPAEEKPKDEKAEGEAEKAGDEEKKEADDSEKKEETKKDDKGKKKKKKDEEEELEPDPITGVWEAQIARPPRAEESPLKMRLHLEGETGSGPVVGNLRCAAVSETLVDVEGYWNREERTLGLTGLGSEGWIDVEAKLEEGKLTGTLSVGGSELDLSAERTSKEWVVAGRDAEPPPKAEPEKEPKGKPKEPKLDEKLEPLRRAFDGKAAVVVEVDRSDEIRDCVELFAAFGLKPVLLGADEAYEVVDEIAGKVAGVLPSPVVLRYLPERGTDYLMPYSLLQSAGIPVAFSSGAEEGAADLPVLAAYAVARGLGLDGALRALTADAAEMLAVGDRIGRLRRGLEADVLLLDGPPLAPSTSVLRVWVNGKEVQVP